MTEQESDSSLQSHYSMHLSCLKLRVMPTGMGRERGHQRARTRSRRVWVIEAEEGGSVESMRCLSAFGTVEPRGERLWVLLIRSALLISRTVSVEYCVVTSLQGIKEEMGCKKIKLIKTTIGEEWQ